MSERREGWYWIKMGDSPWGAAQWKEESWILPGDDVPRDDDELGCVLIGPRIPTPDEPWQCVPVELTEEMEEAALDAYTPFGDMKLAIQAAVAHAPDPEEL